MKNQATPRPTRRFVFSWKISLFVLVLAALMIRASFWQWERHQDKSAFLREMDARIAQKVVPIDQALEAVDQDFQELVHRRLLIEGEYDFANEVVVRNRRHEALGPGVHVVTPLLLQELDQYILVNRGFIPLSHKSREKRAEFQENSSARFMGLVKDSERRRLLAPADPPAGNDRAWVDEWIRVNVEAIQLQLPYPVLPVFVEIMAKGDDIDLTKREIVKMSSSRSEILYLGDLSDVVIADSSLREDLEYPVASYSTVIPSATHLSYVFEWIFLALLTLGIGFLLQLKRPGKRSMS